MPIGYYRDDPTIENYWTVVSVSTFVVWRNSFVLLAAVAMIVVVVSFAGGYP